MDIYMKFYLWTNVKCPYQWNYKFVKYSPVTGLSWSQEDTTTTPYIDNWLSLSLYSTWHPSSVRLIISLMKIMSLSWHELSPHSLTLIASLLVTYSYVARKSNNFTTIYQNSPELTFVVLLNAVKKTGDETIPDLCVVITGEFYLPSGELLDSTISNTLQLLLELCAKLRILE